VRIRSLELVSLDGDVRYCLRERIWLSSKKIPALAREERIESPSDVAKKGVAGFKGSSSSLKVLAVTSANPLTEDGYSLLSVRPGKKRQQLVKVVVN
jgi:hypothetical protein